MARSVATATAVFLGIAGMVGAYLVGQNDKAPPGVTSSQSAVALPTASAVSPSKASEVAKVELIIIASPSDAAITFDGALVENPFRARVNRSSEMHRIRATAQGYQAAEKGVVFDQEHNTVTLSLNLLNKVTRPSGTKSPVIVPPPVAPVSSSQPVSDPMPSHQDNPPSRTIDVEDPYAHGL